MNLKDFGVPDEKKEELAKYLVNELCNAIRSAGDHSVFDVGFHSGHLDQISDAILSCSSIADSNDRIADSIDKLTDKDNMQHVYVEIDSRLGNIDTNEIARSNNNIAEAIRYLADIIKNNDIMLNVTVNK